MFCLSNHIENVLCPEFGKTEIENGDYVVFKPCERDSIQTTRAP